MAHKVSKRSDRSQELAGTGRESDQFSGTGGAGLFEAWQAVFAWLPALIVRVRVRTGMM